MIIMMRKRPRSLTLIKMITMMMMMMKTKKASLTPPRPTPQDLLNPWFEEMMERNCKAQVREDETNEDSLAVLVMELNATILCHIMRQGAHTLSYNVTIT
jgi:hypothetical protein